MRFAIVSCLVVVGSWAQGPASPVVVAKVESKEIASGRSFAASIEAARIAELGAEVDGLVLRYHARVGMRVEAKRALAELRTDEVDDRLAAARATLLLRQREWDELKNGSRPEELAEARARVAQAQAAVEYRAWRVENARRLLKSGSVTEDELKDAVLAARTVEARLAEEKAKLALVVAGPRKERVAAAEARHKVALAEVNRLVNEKKRHAVRAPFAGYVVMERTEVGAWLKQGDPVATIVELDAVDVVVPVLEDFVGGIKVGTEVSVTVDALPGQRFTGAVSRIVPQADRRARTFPVYVRIKNRMNGAAPLLKAGMFARVHLAVGDVAAALLVPKDALVLGGPAPVVWVVDPKTNTVRPVPVATGVAHEGKIAVTGALKAGEMVVTRGNERLRPGQVVKPG